MMHPAADIRTLLQPGKRVHLAGIGGVYQYVGSNGTTDYPCARWPRYCRAWALWCRAPT